MKKIAILGSTGSIGRSLLKVINKNKKFYKIELITAHKNYKELLNQAKFFNIKKVILTDIKSFNLYKNFFKKNNIKIYNDFGNLEKIFPNKKIDYVMSSIVGIEGLMPTIKIIKYTKNIAIANKESIICGWSLIQRELKKYKTVFFPVDSEHFSIWYGLNKNSNTTNIKKIYLTASGGPLLNVPKYKFNKLKIKNIVKHPTWTMGKKISVDSATLMNKVFEIIEAKKIFNLKYNQLDILIHPNSYVHSILEFNDNMLKIIAHKTTMEIPITNTLINDQILKKNFHNPKIDINKLNNLKLNFVDRKKFPLVNILNNLPAKHTLFETVLVASNDELVKLFLDKKINFSNISYYLLKIINIKELKKMKKIVPKNINEILRTNDYVRSLIKKKFYINS